MKEIEVIEVEKESKILIIYGTKSGNSRWVAEKAMRKLIKKGRKVKIYDMADIKPKKLSKYQKVLIVVSTHGKGEPPETAKKFFKKLSNSKTLDLSQLSYSICALGDSSYSHFCEAGIILHKTLKQLNAKAFIPIVKCDKNFETDSKTWIKSCLNHLIIPKVSDVESVNQ